MTEQQVKLTGSKGAIKFTADDAEIKNVSGFKIQTLPWATLQKLGLAESARQITLTFVATDFSWEESRSFSPDEVCHLTVNAPPATIEK